MWLLTLAQPRLRFSHPRRSERRVVATVTHLPTGRRWTAVGRKQGFALLRTLRDAVGDQGRASVLPLNADTVAA